jgi:DNA modification methylase
MAKAKKQKEGRTAGAAGLTFADLTPDTRNARRHGKRNIDAIAAALREVGAARSIVINERGIILAGEGTVKAAAKIGIRKLKVVDAAGDELVAVRRSGLSKKQQARLALFDNRTNELSEWNDEALRALAADGVDLAGGIFTDDELAEMLPGAKILSGSSRAVVDEIIPEVKRTTIQPGDLFELAAHRLLCGDCTKADDVSTLMGEEVANLMATDPPYAIYGSSTGIGSDIADDKMVRPFFLEILTLAKARVALFGHVYICCDWRSWPSWWEMSKRAELSPKNLIVWDKGNAGLGSSYANSYELVGFFAHLPRQTVMTSGQKAGQRQVHASNIWRGPRVTGTEREHNAQKPIELMKFLIENSSNKDDLVLEPFSGSGTTLIAAEQTGRRCYATEIDPRYVQMAINRWEKLTGKQAVKVGTEAAPQRRSA